MRRHLARPHTIGIFGAQSRHGFSVIPVSINQLLRYKYHSSSILLKTKRASTAVEEGSLNAQHTPVVIVGGGPVGLFLSILLSDYHVPHVLLERQSVASRFRHPQAHFINTRSMELFRTVPATITTNTTTSTGVGPTSTLYDRIQNAMAPVRHWQSFRYGTAIHDLNPLAEIVHPVDRPLQANCDANGTLLPQQHSTPQGTIIPTNAKDTTNFNLSPCTVGHLAQHTLGRILYETALEKCHHLSMLQSPSKDDALKSQILYDTSVEHIEWVDHSRTKEEETPPMLHLLTKSQNANTESFQSYYTDLVIAADGAHSTVRQQLWRANQVSTDDIEQHLINVHVTIPMDIANEIHTKYDNYAMLYSVYTPEIIAMIVCHTIGEYVIQIPYFPPYQTVEYDFSSEKVLSYMDAIFGYPDIAQQCHIHSIAPWTMTSWIAQQYYQLSSPSSSSLSKSKSTSRSHNSSQAGVALVGDAAHVFPPAGGFGMNTGLQDAHNIAWKIAAYRHGISKNNGPSAKHRWTMSQILKSYEQERRPIAQQNAALSIRNYERLLEVTKTLYLNAQHPALLCTLLEHSPLPMSVQQDIFRTLLKTALYPLSWLRSTTTTNSESSDSAFSNSNTDWLSYAKHIRSNLRQILHEGAGLPLLFPRFEIGFTYRTDATASTTDTTATTTNDTMPEMPHLEVGRLVPHSCVHVVSGNEHHFPNLKLLQQRNSATLATSRRPLSPVISTTDLPTQMKCPTDTNPIFVLLYISTKSSVAASDSVPECTNICNSIQQRIGGLVVKYAIIQQSDGDEQHLDDRPKKPDAVALASYLVLFESTFERSAAFSFFTSTTKKSSSVHPYYVLIRPDGHISGIVRTSDAHPESTQRMVEQLLEKVN